MSVLTTLCALVVIPAIATVANLLRQLFWFDPNVPPEVWHWLPLIGSTVEYGMDPYKFFFRCRAKYGDCFTFVLLGKKTTVYLGAEGNKFILNGSSQDLNAEEIYRPLTAPVFGKGVVYDCPNEKLMDQKRLLIQGFSGACLRAYVPQFVKEVEQFVKSSPIFKDDQGICDISAVMAEITLYSAAGSLQGKEIRAMMDERVALLYRHLDDGFAPINYMLPWLPLPQNVRRDRAQKKMHQLYLDVIKQRRLHPTNEPDDMISILMKSRYRDNNPIPDVEIANLMIALLMGGQHNTSATGTWIILHLAHQPRLIEELYQEMTDVLGSPDAPLTYAGLKSLKLNATIIKETLRLHSPIHSVMRKVKRPMRVPGTLWTVPPNNTLLSAPNFLSRVEDFFPNAMEWDPHRWDNLTAKGVSVSNEDVALENDSSADKSNVKTRGDIVDFGYGPISLKAAGSPYLPFGGGRHRCVGEEYAYLQLGAIIATMVKLFRWEQVDPKAPVPETDYSNMSGVNFFLLLQIAAQVELLTKVRRMPSFANGTVEVGAYTSVPTVTPNIGNVDTKAYPTGVI